MQLNESILEALLAENKINFINCIEKYLQGEGIKRYIIWDINNRIATVNVSRVDDPTILFSDISDLGYNHLACKDFDEPIRFTEFTEIYQTFFLEHGDTLLLAVSICEPTALKCRDFNLIIPYLSSKLYDIIAAESRTEIFVEYQKKVDFIKKAYDILKFLEFESIFSKALSFFLEIFDAQAGFTIYKNQFYSIGLESKDIKEDIFINDVSLGSFLESVVNTEYFDSGIRSNKFIIKNMFVIFEEKLNIKIVLFNISTNFYPDKEFSEIISHITSIAVENAINHQRELNLKLEENEMKTTAEILNRFVDREVSVSCDMCDIFGVSYPAKQAGGDFLGLCEKEDSIMICLADVCGKGYSAAVVTVAMSTMFQVFVKSDDFKPSHFARYLSKFLMDKNLDGRFVTLFFGVIYKRKNIMEYISLGHEPVFLKDGDSLKKITSEYMPAGIFEEDYRDSEVEISKGSSIFVYSDGLVEYVTYEEIEKRFKECDTDVKTFISTLYNELVTDKDHQMDDFTCIKIDIKG